MNLKKAEMITMDLLRFHLPNGFTFGFDRSQRRFGACQNRVGHTPLILVSRVLTELNSEEQFIESVLHEIAHALTPGANHGSQWRTLAVSIGSNGSRCYSDDVIKPTAKFTGTCPACSRVIHRVRRTRIACGRCCSQNGGAFDEQFLFQWEVSK